MVSKMSDDVNAGAIENASQLAPLIPNEETIEAMKAERRGNLVTVSALDKLLVSLNVDA